MTKFLACKKCDETFDISTDSKVWAYLCHVGVCNKDVR